MTNSGELKAGNRLSGAESAELSRQIAGLAAPASRWPVDWSHWAKNCLVDRSVDR